MYLKSVNVAHPLKYFFDLEKGILNEYYHEFIIDPAYLPKKNKRWVYFQDHYSGVTFDYDETFEESIKSTLKFNSNKIIEFLYAKVNREKSIVVTYPYLLKVKKDLLLLIDKYKSSDIIGSQEVLQSLLLIKNEMDNRLLSYIELGISSISNQTAKQSRETLNKINKAVSIRAYNWLGEYFNVQILFLHTLLINNKIIDKNTDPYDLKKAFSGEPLEKPIKIKWTVMTKNKKHTNKVSLLYFLSRLSDEKLIEYTCDEDTNKSEYKRISLIFCDFTGKPLSAFKQSKQNYLSSNSPEKSEIIDNIILDLTRLTPKH